MKFRRLPEGLKQMKVLYLIDQQQSPGAAESFGNCLSTLRQGGVEPEFAILNNAQSSQDPPVVFQIDAPIWDLPWSPSVRRRKLALRELAREVKPRLVHNTAFVWNLLAWRACSWRDVMVIGSIEHSVLHLRKQFGRVGTFMRCGLPNIQVCGTTFIAAQLTDELPRFMWPWVHVVPPAVPDRYFLVDLPMTIGVPRILVQPVCSGEASAEVVRQISEVLEAKGFCHQIELAHVSTDRLAESPLETSFEDQLRQATCLICPAVPEGLPPVVAIAMAAGRPVLAPDTSDMPKHIRHGVSGMLFPEGNIRSIAENVIHLLEQPDMVQRLGQAARETAQRSFSAQSMGKRLLDVYELLKKGNQPKWKTPL